MCRGRPRKGGTGGSHLLRNQVSRRGSESLLSTASPGWAQERWNRSGSDGGWPARGGLCGSQHPDSDSPPSNPFAGASRNGRSHEWAHHWRILVSTEFPRCLQAPCERGLLAKENTKASSHLDKRRCAIRFLPGPDRFRMRRATARASKKAPRSADFTTAGNRRLVTCTLRCGPIRCQGSAGHRSSGSGTPKCTTRDTEHTSPSTGTSARLEKTCPPGRGPETRLTALILRRHRAYCSGAAQRLPIADVWCGLPGHVSRRTQGRDG